MHVEHLTLHVRPSFLRLKRVYNQAFTTITG